MFRLGSKPKFFKYRGSASAFNMLDAVLSASIFTVLGRFVPPYIPLTVAAHSYTAEENVTNVGYPLTVSVENQDGRDNGVVPPSSLTLREQSKQHSKLLETAGLKSAGFSRMPLINAAALATAIIVLFLTFRCFRLLGFKAGQRRLMGEDDSSNCSVSYFVPFVWNRWVKSVLTYFRAICVSCGVFESVNICYRAFLIMTSQRAVNSRDMETTLAKISPAGKGAKKWSWKASRV